jgi:putative transposase
LQLATDQKRALIEPTHPTLSLARQCALLGLPRSSWYYHPAATDPLTQELLNRLDEQYTRTPFYGVRRMTAWLNQEGYGVNAKRVRRLLRLLGVETLYPKPRLSTAAPGHRIYPYLLRDVAITHVDQVWSSDITYIRLAQGWLYLVAVLDWHSRYVLAWEVSNTLDTAFCLRALEQALAHGRPGIFNTDQGSQFTSYEFTGRLQAADVQISMDGRGRALDNVFVERLWRSVKYEEVYLKSYASVPVAIASLASYFRFYNEERLHQALDYRPPATIYAERPLPGPRLG